MRLLSLLLAFGALAWTQEYRFFEGGTERHAYRLSEGGILFDLRELPPQEKLDAMPRVARERRMQAARRTMTRTLLVKMDAERAAELEQTGATGAEPSLLPGWMLVRYASPRAALQAADWMLASGGWEVQPVLARRMEKKQVMQREVNDTLFGKQWHLGTEGFHLNLRDTWDKVSGKGINIAVVDDGLDIRHEDLRDSAYPVETGYHANFNGGPRQDPTPLVAEESHGTACAGLAAATGFNNRGVVGVAPEARLMGLRLLAGDSTDEDAGTSLAWQPKGLVTHVSSNSWGPADNGTDLGRVSPLQMAGMEKAATTYRDGLGTVFAIACGNGRQDGDDSSYDAFSGSRFAIGVAAVNREGVQSSYSENGMNVAISAFGGEYDPPGVMWSTNVSGADAFGLKASQFPSTTAPVNYTDAFNGTSAAVPQISGVAALLLERNPRLGYRDVKEILLRTAFREGLKGSDPFVENGAGFHFSHSFGAGLVNVAAAVEKAAEWQNLGPLVSAEAVNRETGAIADGGDAAVREIEFSGAPNIRVEHVELVVNVKHPKRGDLSFAIESPSGMKSIAAPRPPDDGADFIDYQFTSVRHWGEASTGTWKVKVLDTVGNGAAGAIQNVTLRVYGTVLP